MGQDVDDSTIGNEMTERTNMHWSVCDDGLRSLFLYCVVSLAVVSVAMLMKGSMPLL